MSTWGDVAAAVSKFAPILGNAVPGVGTVVGAGVGLAASVIAKALGTDPTPDSVMSALSTDPDAIVKLKQAEMDHESDLAKIAASREQAQLSYQQSIYSAEASDRDSARKLAAQQPKDFMRPLLAIVLMSLTAYMVWAVMGGHADSVIKDTTAALTVGTLIGYVLSENKQVLGFYFGMTQDGSRTNAVVRDFAVAPGAVTAPAGPSSPSTTTVQTDAPVAVGQSSDIFKGH